MVPGCGKLTISSIVPAADLTCQDSTEPPGTSLTLMPVFCWNCLKVAVNLASSSPDKPCERLTVVPLYCPFMALAISGPICDQSIVSQLAAGPDALPPAAVMGVVPAMASVAVAPGAEV